MSIFLLFSCILSVVFYQLFVAPSEGRNTGFRKIRYALRNNGSPEPLFEADDERTYFSTTLYIHPYFLKEQSKKGGNK